MDNISPFYYDGTMYVSDVSSLIVNPMEIKVAAGEYTMKPHKDGFIYTKTTYGPQMKDIVKVLNFRDGDPGLLGTYYGGITDNKAVMRLVNNYFIHYVDRCYDDEDDSVEGRFPYESKPRRVKCLPDCNNLPILFFLNTKPVAKTLNLKKEYEDENKIAVWNVIDCKRGKIGVAIGQRRFANLMGDQMGLAAFSINGKQGVAFGNFEMNTIPDDVDMDVFYPHHKTSLEYKRAD